MEQGTVRVKRGLADMLKGGVIMDVTSVEQAKIAEDAGAVAVMALERVPADIRRDGGVARMADPTVVEAIIGAVTIEHRLVTHHESVAAAAPLGQVRAAALFPDLPIASVQNGRWPGSVPDDHQILLGGVGSDVWHGPSDPPDELWMVTDRGPRGRGDNGDDRQAFAIPEYTPMILHVRLGAVGSDGVGGVEVLETLPIVGQSGQPVTGPCKLPLSPAIAEGVLNCGNECCHTVKTSFGGVRLRWCVRGVSQAHVRQIIAGGKENAKAQPVGWAKILANVYLTYCQSQPSRTRSS